MTQQTTDTDIAIIGGGPVGLALAMALCGGGTASRVTVLEARREDDDGDSRPIALSWGSRLLLERLGVWRDMVSSSQAGVIRQVHISQRGGFGCAAMSAADAGVPDLGYVFDLQHIFRCLWQARPRVSCTFHQGVRVTALARDGGASRIEYIHEGVAATLTTRLAVIADGGGVEGLVPPKVIDYHQHALAARVHTERPHAGVAYERFTDEGPLALLPFGEHVNDMALVWTLKPARAEILRDAEPAICLAALQEAFGHRLGRFLSITQRAAHPLALRYASDHAMPGVIAIGNAAQTLHPVAGQGFNLGLRDAWELAQLLRTIPVPSLGDEESLRRYRANRRVDRRATIAATHGLVQLFSNDFPPLRAARGMGLTLLGCLPPVRDALSRRMIFGARG